jgi:hypothetical protein
MKRTLAVFLSAVVASSILYAQQKGDDLRDVRIHKGFVKARLYLDFGDDGQRAYAMGLLDGMYMAPAFGAPDNDKVLVRIANCIEGMQSSQVAAIIGKYVRDHPEKWDRDLKDAGYSAVLEACRNR